MATFLAFSGSARKDSANQKTVNSITAALRKDGAEVTDILLTDFPQPIYDGDEEQAQGLSEGTEKFKELLSAHDAFVIGCPEYNGFMTPLLLNAINWATRSNNATPDLSCFTGKPVLVVSASPGGLGGIRASTYLKTMLTGVGCLVSNESFMVPSAFGAFDEAGIIKDEGIQKRAVVVAKNFNKLTLTQQG